MPVGFQAVAEPSPQLCAEAEALDPTNPFCTYAYLQAMRRQGADAWMLMLMNESRPVSACAVFVRSGRVNRSAEIVSLPPLADAAVFWTGFEGWCRQQRITSLEIGTFGSAAFEPIPPFGIETERRPRTEYVLDLTAPVLWKGAASNHLRNAKNARKAGVALRRSTREEALRAHVSLVTASLARRKDRGELVPDETSANSYAACVESGCGELFQATRGDEVVSSILVLKSSSGAYYQSAGTSPEGMSCGASHFLVQEIAETLRGEGTTLFNLGGADEASGGLRRFKAGFGAREVQLEAAAFFLGGPLRKKLMTAAAMVRQDPSAVLRRLAGTVERYVVYTADAGSVPPPEPVEGLRLEQLSDAELVALSNRPEAREQAQRFERLGFNEAFGVWKDGKLAHVAWLIPADRDALQEVRNVKLRAGEAEITHCLTLPEFRGQGMYPFAIRSLCDVARQRGIHRIYMITSVENLASQRGIEKAGLTRGGEIIRLTDSYLPLLKDVTYRGHRWGLRQAWREKTPAGR